MDRERQTERQRYIGCVTPCHPLRPSPRLSVSCRDAERGRTPPADTLRRGGGGLSGDQVDGRRETSGGMDRNRVTEEQEVTLRVSDVSLASHHLHILRETHLVNRFDTDGGDKMKLKQSLERMRCTCS